MGRRLVEDYEVSIVDINFGCPVKQVTERAKQELEEFRKAAEKQEIKTGMCLESRRLKT